VAIVGTVCASLPFAWRSAKQQSPGGVVELKGGIADIAFRVCSHASGLLTRFDVGCGRRLSALLAPSPGVTPHGIVTTVVAAPAQLFEDPDYSCGVSENVSGIPLQPVLTCEAAEE